MKSTVLAEVNDFFQHQGIAIVGISTVKSKFGNYIYKMLEKRNEKIYPIHRTLTEFRGNSCYTGIAQLPDSVDSIILNTRPAETKVLVEEALKRGIRKIWLQPGSDDSSTLEGINAENALIIRNECIIMHMEKPGFPHSLHRFFHVRKLIKAAM